MNEPVDTRPVTKRLVPAYGPQTELDEQRERLKMIVKRRHDLAAHLGNSLYQDVRHSSSLRYGRERIIAEMELSDTERAECEARIASLEREVKAAANAAARMMRCPRCGALMFRGDKFCGACGMPAQTADPSPSKSGDPESDATVCPKCGASLREGDAFCMECGEKIPIEDGSLESDETQEPTVCPSCGEPLSESQKFCGKCGAPVNREMSS